MGPDKEKKALSVQLSSFVQKGSWLQWLLPRRNTATAEEAEGPTTDSAAGMCTLSTAELIAALSDNNFFPEVRLRLAFF